MSPLYNPVVTPGVRAQQPAVGEYFTAQASSNSTILLSALGVLNWVPIDIGVSTNVDALAINITSAGAGTNQVIRFGLWADTGTNRPGSLLVDAGTQASLSTGDKVAPFTALRLAPGRYWAGCAVQVALTTGPTVVSVNNLNPAGVTNIGNASVRSWQQVATATGAFAASATTLTRANVCPHLCLRVSA